MQLKWTKDTSDLFPTHLHGTRDSRCSALHFISLSHKKRNSSYSSWRSTLSSTTSNSPFNLLSYPSCSGFTVHMAIWHCYGYRSHVAIWENTSYEKKFPPKLFTSFCFKTVSLSVSMQHNIIFQLLIEFPSRQCACSQHYC